MNRPIRLKPALMACTAGLSLLAAQPAFAQSVDSAKLLELMVAKGLVTRAEAGLLTTRLRPSATKHTVVLVAIDGDAA